MAVLPATSGTLLEKGASGVCVRRAVRTAPKTLRPVDWTSVCCVLLRGLDATKAVPPSGAVSDEPQGENRGGGAVVSLPTADPGLEVAHTSLKSSDGGNLGDSEVVDIRGDGRQGAVGDGSAARDLLPERPRHGLGRLVRLARQTIRRGLRRRVRELHRREPLLELRQPDHDERPGPERELTPGCLNDTAA